MYYLCSGVWYRMMSANYFRSDNHVDIIHIRGDGNISSDWSGGIGGVRIFRIMLIIFLLPRLDFVGQCL